MRALEIEPRVEGWVRNTQLLGHPYALKGDLKDLKIWLFETIICFLNGLNHIFKIVKLVEIYINHPLFIWSTFDMFKPDWSPSYVSLKIHDIYGRRGQIAKEKLLTGSPNPAKQDIFYW